MLRAYSSRIVRSVVGCMALMLVLVATACPTFGASTARAVESLSATELATLPDTTLVRLKTGRTVTLGVLRSEHKLRLQRFGQAAKLGALQRQELAKQVQLHKGALGNLFSSTTLVPMSFSLIDFQDNLPFPEDFSAFCEAAVATACLYFPSAVMYLVTFGTSANAGVYVDYDPLMTDQQLCQSEGGVAGSSSQPGCNYYYPAQYNLTFNPGQPTAQGYSVTHVAICARPFAYTVDPHGAVALNVPGRSTPPSRPSVVTLPSVASCVVQVFVGNR